MLGPSDLKLTSFVYFPMCFVITVQCEVHQNASLCEKCPNTEFFLVCIFHIRTEYGDLRSKFPYSVRIRENRDKKKHRIWTLFTQCITEKIRSRFVLFISLKLQFSWLTSLWFLFRVRETSNVKFENMPWHSHVAILNLNNFAKSYNKERF